ncbi:MAG: PilN domain-containing protein [Dehalococcoidia bacterium]|nr:PilN domain-containing protein [Dehalococcoidia bacterium]
MASEERIERRPKLIDLNLLPPEYLPRKVSKLSVALVLLVIVGLCLIYPLVNWNAGIDAETAPDETQLAQLKAEEALWMAKGPEANQLRAAIASAQALLATIDQDYETFVAGLVMWSEIIYDIDDARPGKRITVEEIDQSGSTLTLVGTATKRAYVYDYARALEETGRFVVPVVIKSMEDTGAGIEFEIVSTLSSGGGQ